MSEIKGLATRCTGAILCLCMLCQGVACASEPPATPEVPEAVTALGIPAAAVPLPGLLTGGQVTESQIPAALAEMGYRTFVNLQTEGEKGTGWEEAYAAEHGLSFTRIPIGGVKDLSMVNAERLAAALQVTEESGPVVLYCRSSNRVGALLAMKCHQLDGGNPGECLELGRSAGMTRLEPTVRRLLGLEDDASTP